MALKKVVACGIDVHKQVLVACAVDDDGHAQQWLHAKNDPDGLQTLKEWLSKHQIKVVGFESTGSYWKQLYEALEEDFTVHVANARMVKHIPDCKTDKRDARWLGQLLAKGLFPSSYVPPKWQRELRELTRFRLQLVDKQTQVVNQLRALLDRYHVDVIRHFSSWHLQACYHVLQQLAQGITSWEALLASTQDGRTRKALERKKDVLEPLVHQSNRMPRSARLQLQCLLEQLQLLSEQISRVWEQICHFIDTQTPPWFRHQVTLAMTLPGMGKVSVISLLAEIGKIQRFPTGDQLVSWAGLNPYVHESAGKRYTGFITKQGNKYVRKVLYSCVKPTLRAKRSPFAAFYRRLRKRNKPGRVAAVAVMAKMLRVLHSMLRHDQPYLRDKGGTRRKS